MCHPITHANCKRDRKTGSRLIVAPLRQRKELATNLAEMFSRYWIFLTSFALFDRAAVDRSPPRRSNE
jgi:hypothetical protein